MDKNISSAYDRSHVLMSSDLEGQLPEIDDEAMKFEDRFIIFVSKRNILMLDEKGNKLDEVNHDAFVCSVVSFLTDAEPEIEVKLTIKEGMDFVKNCCNGKKTIFKGFALHLCDDVMNFEGDYAVDVARLQDIDHEKSRCVISMKLHRV